jgi:hypothetical protein
VLGAIVYAAGTKLDPFPISVPVSVRESVRV